MGWQRLKIPPQIHLKNTPETPETRLFSHYNRYLKQFYENRTRHHLLYVINKPLRDLGWQLGWQGLFHGWQVRQNHCIKISEDILNKCIVCMCVCTGLNSSSTTADLAYRFVSNGFLTCTCSSPLISLAVEEVGLHFKSCVFKCIVEAFQGKDSYQWCRGTLLWVS